MNFSQKPSRKSVVLLFSGGLDSILAYKHLERMGFKVFPVFFKTSFFDEKRALEYAQRNDIPLKVVDVSEEYLEEVVMKPKFGYGVGMNPCKDCRIFMLKKAYELARSMGMDFVATGEVVGQRPLTQGRNALFLVEKEAGVSGRVIRPLTGRKLPPTIAEKEGLYHKDQLLGISGRGRKAQFALAKEYGVKSYPTPAGGCILTDPIFSKKLRLFLLDLKYPVTVDFTKLLKLGRHFYVDGLYYLILARNSREERNFTSLRDSLVSDYGDRILVVEKPGSAGSRGDSHEEASVLGFAFLLKEFSKEIESLKVSGEISGENYVQRLKNLLSPPPEYLVAPYLDEKKVVLKYLKESLVVDLPSSVEKYEVADYFLK